MYKVETKKIKIFEDKNDVYQNITYNEIDVKMLKKSKTLFVNNIKNMIYFDIQTEDNKIIRKYTTQKKENFFYKFSSEDIERKNILQKNPQEILDQIYKIIFSMNIDNSFKLILKNFFNIDNVLNKTPILIFNEKENKKQWYIPKSIEENGIFLDYEKDIPFFSGNGDFIDDFFTTTDKALIIINQEGLESQINNFNSCFDDEGSSWYLKYIYKNNDLPKDFVFYTSKHDLSKGSTLHYFSYENNKVSLPCFDVSILKIDETIELLEKINSNKTLDDVKNSLNKFINDFEENKINNETTYNQILYNYQFIFSKYNYLNNGEENNIKYIANHQIDTKHIGNYLSIKSYNIKGIEYLKYKNIFEENNINYVEINEREGITVLPKDNNKWDKNINNNFIKMINNKEDFVEDNVLIINNPKYVNENKIIKFENKIKKSKNNKFYLNEFNESHSKNDGLYLFHNDDDTLYLINLENKKIIDLEKQKSFKSFNKSLVNFLNLDVKNSVENDGLIMLSLENEILIITKYDDLDNYGEVKIDYKKIKIDEINEEFKMKFYLPVLKKSYTEFLYNTNRGMIKNHYVNNKKEIDFNICGTDDENKYNKISIEYTFKSELIYIFGKVSPNVPIKWEFFNESLSEIKITNESIDKDEFIKFMDNIYTNTSKTCQQFSLNFEKDNLIFETKNEMLEDYILLKNKNKNISLFLPKKENYKFIIKKFVHNKVNPLIKSPLIKNIILPTDDTLITYDKNYNFIMLNNFDYNNTKNEKNTILNDKNSLNFYNNKKDLMLITLDKNSNIKSTKNLNEEIKINKNLNVYGLSFN